jgi:SAM-dependent methyltransferase
MQGRGEATGLPDGSVDLVLCAQAFHWFDAFAALREFYRILKTGGRLALMWNMKLPSNPFSSRFCEIAEAAQRDAETRGLRVPSERAAEPTLGGFFSNVQRRAFNNPQRLDLEGVLGRMRSASYFPKSGSQRDFFEQELRTAFERNQQNGCVVLEHDAEVTLADRV